MRKGLLFFLGLLVCGLVRGQGEPPLPAEVLLNGVEFRLVPGGWFAYPVPDIDPRTGYFQRKGMRELRVWVDGYYLAKYEARARDFARFMNAGGVRFADNYEPQPRLTGDGATQGCSVRKNDEGKYYLLAPQADLPATHLSWNLANEFAQWMGFRLPTEAEWVRAFRGDDRRVFPWGDEYPDDTFAAFEEGGVECNVQPVTALPKGQSPYGVYNMAGNVYEYVADWYNVEYYGQLRDGVRNPVAREAHVLPSFDQAMRPLRGGRWASSVSELSIYGNRDVRAANEPFRCFGARFAIDIAVVQQHLAAGSAVAR